MEHCKLQVYQVYRQLLLVTIPMFALNFAILCKQKWHNQLLKHLDACSSSTGV